MSEVKKIRPKPVEGVDFYREPGGRLVFTEVYHLKRGYCCNGCCRHCPYKKKVAIELEIINLDTCTKGETKT